MRLKTGAGNSDHHQENERIIELVPDDQFRLQIMMFSVLFKQLGSFYVESELRSAAKL